jgi:hypothetical protein
VDDTGVLGMEIGDWSASAENNWEYWVIDRKFGGSEIILSRRGYTVGCGGGVGGDVGGGVRGALVLLYGFGIVGTVGRLRRKNRSIGGWDRNLRRWRFMGAGS